MDNRIIELLSEEIRELRKANQINDKKADAALEEAKASMKRADASMETANAAMKRADASMETVNAAMKRADASMETVNAAMKRADASWHQSQRTQDFLEVVIHNLNRSWFEKVLGLNRYKRA